MYLTTQGLVLRVTDYNDRDALLTLLTPNHGKITAKARGLRRKNSPLTAPCQLLAYGNYTLFENAGRYTINEATSIALFQGVQREITKLALGTYFAQAAELLSQEDIPTPELLSLVLNCLHTLSEGKTPEEKVKSVFELRAACIAGYMPDLGCCHSCGAAQAQLFDLSEGRLECAACSHFALGTIRFPVSPGTLEAMRYIVSCDPKRLFAFSLGEENLLQLSQATEAYLTTQLERGFSALDFYKSLFV